MTDTSPRPDATVWPDLPGPAGARRRGASWVLFAGIMIALLGVFDTIDGIAATADSRVVV